MSTGLLANGRGRWLAVVVSLVVSGAMLYAQGTEPPSRTEPPAAGPASQGATPVPAQGSAPMPTTVQGFAPTAGPSAAAPTEAELLASSQPVGLPDIQLALPEGVAPEQGLQIHTIWAARAISMMFPEITIIGGAREDALPWHPNGLAIDVMIPDHNSDAGRELGNQIAGIALANANKWGVIHVIWRQGFYPAVDAPSWMADYGNETANHYDHVHIATDGGGFPTGDETYYIGSMRTAESE